MPLLMTVLTIALSGAICAVFWRKSARMDYVAEFQEEIEDERSQRRRC